MSQHTDGQIMRMTYKTYVAVGLTLIELMFALTLSLLILGLATTLYLNAQKNFNLQATLSSLQENALFASEILRSELKSAGYIGCPKLTDDFPLTSLPTYAISARNKITINKNSITVWHVHSDHTNLIQKMENNSVLATLPFPEFMPGNILLISDCQTAEMFEVKKVSIKNQIQTLTTVQPLHTRYEKNAEVGLFAVNTFFIANTGRIYADGKPLYALYQSDIHQRKMELVEGVEMLDGTWDQKGVAVAFNVGAPLLTKTWRLYVALN